MGGADPGQVGLEVGPNQHDAQMVGSESRYRVEVSLNRIRVPLIPTEPPVTRRGVVDAESVTAQRIALALSFAQNRLKRAGAGYSGMNWIAPWLPGCYKGRAGPAGQKLPAIHRSLSIKFSCAARIYPGPSGTGLQALL